MGPLHKKLSILVPFPEPSVPTTPPFPTRFTLNLHTDSIKRTPPFCFPAQRQTSCLSFINYLPSSPPPHTPFYDAIKLQGFVAKVSSQQVSDCKGND